MRSKINHNLKKDQLISKCEKLLVRGVESITDMSSELGVSFNTARGYIEVVKSRWVDSKSIEQLQAEREGLIKKTQEVIRECWNIKSTAKNALEATQALRTIIMAVEQLRRLQGLDLLPLHMEESSENQIYDMAQSVRQLPKEEYKIAMQMIRTEIIKKSDSTNNSLINKGIQSGT